MVALLLVISETQLARLEQEATTRLVEKEAEPEPKRVAKKTLNLSQHPSPLQPPVARASSFPKLAKLSPMLMS